MDHIITVQTAVGMLPPMVKPAEYYPFVYGGEVTMTKQGKLRVTKSNKKVEAYINHGRWIGDCPECPAAQIVDPDDPRMLCPNCGGGWFTVVFPPPKKKAEIEEQLLRVPRQENRNWNTWESVDDVKADIDAHLFPPPIHAKSRKERYELPEALSEAPPHRQQRLRTVGEVTGLG